MESGGAVKTTVPEGVEAKAELTGPQIEVKSQRRAAEVEPGWWRTVGTAVQVRTEAEPEGRRKPTKPYGWRDEVQPKAQKYMVRAEQ